MSEKFAKLKSKQGEKFGLREINYYPRPQLVRDSFMSLNGKWEFTLSKSSSIPHSFDREILVPFCPESELSGIGEVFPEELFRFYKKEFSLNSGFLNERVLLHFGAVDSECEVFVNGKSVATHKGGYDAFCIDITDVLEEKNIVIVRAWDYLSRKILPYGKQSNKRGGMWYTSVSGIWQTVWLESTPSEYIKRLETKTKGDTAFISAIGVKQGTIKVKTQDGGELSAELNDGCAEITVPNPIYWSPENPFLYLFTVQSGNDKVESYFGLRDLKIKKVGGKSRLCLNGEPYFFHGLLDQGYFCDGIFTPASLKCYAEDIKLAKSLGFNMLRKHIKIEPELFYYYCDLLGVAVFQDMINNSDYSFLRDTALPTAFLKKLDDKRLHKNKESRAEFERYMQVTLQQLSNHPCICYWTIFNEGWGQFESGKMYDKLKSLDDSRFIDTASGWFKGAKSDVESEHVYFKRYSFKPSQKPTVLSEFGGYSLKIDGHIFNLKNSYGYGSFKSCQEFENAFIKLYENEVIPAVKKGLCASVYTQLTDVEDEINGLVTYDRKVVKVTKEKMCEVSRKLKAAAKK